MAKRKSKRKFAMVEKEILYSQAWMLLTHSARVVYFHLKGEFTGLNSDSLVLPYLQARKGFGPLSMKDVISRVAFYEGMKNLEEIGFIDRISPGQKTRFEKGQSKTPESVYKLSNRWRIHGLNLQEHARLNADKIQEGLFDQYSMRQEDETEP